MSSTVAVVASCNSGRKSSPPRHRQWVRSLAPRVDGPVIDKVLASRVDPRTVRFSVMPPAQDRPCWTLSCEMGGRRRQCRPPLMAIGSAIRNRPR